MKCFNCGEVNPREKYNHAYYCDACLEPTKVYEPTPEQKKRMDEAMIKINKKLAEVFK